MTSRVSLAELAAADIQLRPAEAVAIVCEICRQYIKGQLSAIPSPAVIRLTSDGQIVVEGPMTIGPGGVARAALLLNDLLPEFGVPSQYRASGGLRLVIARALGTLDLPPYGSLEELCEALRRFALPDIAPAARTLYHAWESKRAASEVPAASPGLTISDVRRARRATGLSLDDLAAVSEVPAVRLRELEWGYMRNWRADADGRDCVVRYARAAGLDEELVLSIAWPMIEEAVIVHGSEPEIVVGIVPSESQALIPATPPAAQPTRSRVHLLGLASATAAVLCLATLAAFSLATSEDAGAAQTVRAEAVDRPTVSETRSVAGVSPETRPAAADAPPDARPAVAIRASSKRPWTSSAVRPAVRSGATVRTAPKPSRPPAPKKTNFFQRELFRIVIK